MPTVANTAAPAAILIRILGGNASQESSIDFWFAGIFIVVFILGGFVICGKVIASVPPIQGLSCSSCSVIVIMFTGLIEHLGTISNISRTDAGCTLVISDSSPILPDCHIGDSIAVNGACLTVTSFHPTENNGWFQVWLANETLQRTELGDRKEGDQVNLERAMGSHTRFGGHFVQAHVDTTATICERFPDGDSLRLTFQLPFPSAGRESLLPFLITKGYITLDGASLTLTNVNDEKRQFSIMVIQHTQGKITLGTKKIGEKVNVEVDMVGKYVEKSVVAALGDGEGSKGIIPELVEKLVVKVLKENKIIQ